MEEHSRLKEQVHRPKDRECLACYVETMVVGLESVSRKTTAQARGPWKEFELVTAMADFHLRHCENRLAGNQTNDPCLILRVVIRKDHRI
jgi:hypothetical protein